MYLMTKSILQVINPAVKIEIFDKKQQGGGLLVYIKDNLNCIIRKDLSKYKRATLWLNIKPGNVIIYTYLCLGRDIIYVHIHTHYLHTLMRTYNNLNINKNKKLLYGMINMAK